MKSLSRLHDFLTEEAAAAAPGRSLTNSCGREGQRRILLI